MTPRASRAIDALRKPDSSLSRVPNTIRQSIAEVIEDQATAMERAYGVLWRMTDGSNGMARKILLEHISPEGQKRGIAYATEIFGPATEAELQLAAMDALRPTAIITKADNDLIRTMQAERNKLKANLGTVLGALRYHEEATGEDYDDTGGDIAAIEHETLNG